LTDAAELEGSIVSLVVGVEPDSSVRLMISHSDREDDHGEEIEDES
jgi:hypothetical protein